MATSIRTFVAIDLNADVRDQAERLQSRLGASGADVRWVKPESMHLTLQFLGDVEPLQLPEICKAAQLGIGSQEPFTLHFEGAGGFPNNKRPRTIWLGVGHGQELLLSLQDAIQQQLAAIGFRPEQRRYHPHITLGRLRSSRAVEELSKLVEKNVNFEAGELTVKQVITFSSQLEPDGPVYSPIGRANL